MKKFCKRTLSMLLAMGLTASMLVSDLSVMQVNAAGGMNFTAGGESSTVEMVTEDVTEEVISGEEVSSAEETSEETEEVSSDVVAEETTEAVSAETSEEAVEEETTVVETTVEEATVEETVVTEETTTEAVIIEETVVETVEEVPGAIEVAAAAKFTITANAETGMMEVAFEDGVTKLSGDIVIPKEVKVIPKNDSYFNKNREVTSVTFENGSLLERIEDEAFMSSSIMEIKIPAKVSYIGNSAFMTTALKKVTLLSSAESITLGESAFQSNDKLTTFISNGRLGVIGNYAFAGNLQLNSFIKSSSYDDGALDGVIQIGEGAFSGCSALEYIKIPETVSIIEKKTFENCKTFGKSSRVYYTGNTAVDFGTGVIEIKDNAFSGCTGLTELVLPKNVAKLGSDVFKNCTAIKSIEVYNQDGVDETDACAIQLTDTSFPYKKGLVLKAYNGTVKEWVQNRKDLYNVEFKSLYKEYTISYAKTIKNGTIKANIAKAQKGALVSLAIQPEEGYALDYNSLVYFEKNGTRKGQIDLKEYTFKMPDYNVEIRGDFVPLSERDYGEKLILAENGIEANLSVATYDEAKGVLEFSKSWQTARVMVDTNGSDTPGCEELIFKSDNTKIATIDARGNMRVTGTGEANITISYADEDKKIEPLKIKVKVGEKTFVTSLSLDYEADKMTKELANSSDEYDIISLKATTVNSASHEIKVTFDGKDKDGDKLDVTYQISSNDTAIAKPKTTKATGTGTIVVPKGALGETIITVKAVDGAKEPIQKQFVVRVIDNKPRLANSTITVDPQSVTGTLLDLVSVYNTEMNLSDLSILKKVVKNGETSWELVDDLFYLDDEVEAGKVYLRVKEPKDKPYVAGQKYTYKNTYYVHGKINETDLFYIVIPNLTVCKRKISTAMKVTGKINLFYNGTADIAKLGSVTVVPKNTKTDLKMSTVKLVGKEKTNGVNEDDDKAFAENFTASLDTEKQTITIVRTPDDTALSCYTDGKSKNKPVLNGYLRVWYEGYGEEYYEDINLTVPTHTTIPSYKLNLAKITLNDKASGQEYKTKFVDKKAKKGTDATVDLTEGTIISLDKLNATTSGLVDDEDISKDPENDELTIRINKVKKGKIVLTLRQSDWEDQSGWNKKAAIKATINVAVTTVAPVAKLGKTTFKLNKACPDATDYTTIKLNQTDSALTDVEFIPVSKNTAGIELSYDSATQTIKAAINGDAAKGTHSFKCTPVYLYNGSSMDRDAKSITVRVSVANAAPSIKLKSSTFTVNAYGYKWGARKYDEKTIAFTWVNLPSEYSNYTLSSEDVALEYRGTKADPLDGEDRVHFVADGVAKTATVYIESDSKVSGKSTYRVTGLKLVNDDGDRIAINPFNITVNSINKLPTVTVTAKGTINPLDPASKIEYTPKLTNISGTITGVEMWEYDEFGKPLEDAAEHFVPVHDPATGKTTVKVKDGVQLENRTYKISLFYELSNGEDGDGWLDAQKLYEVAKVQQIKPKQTMPKLTIDKTSVTFYAGNKERTQTITVTKKDTTTANITEINFADEKWEKSFKINSFNPVTGEMELKLINSAFIKQNVEQTIRFEIVCDGQLKDTKGRTFDVKVKVIK